MTNFPRLAFFVSGNGTNAKAIIDSCRKSNLNACPVLLISNNKRSEALFWAKSYNLRVEYLNPKNFSSLDEVDRLHLNILKNMEVDLVILAGYLSKIGDKVIKYFKNRIINIHPSLLPKYGGKGMYGVKIHERVIESGDVETGITIHLVSGEYDTGNIIAQKKIKVLKNDTAYSLSQRVLKQEHIFYTHILNKILSGEIDLGNLE